MATHSSILAQRIPMDKGAWWAAVHGVSKSHLQLSTAHGLKFMASLSCACAESLSRVRLSATPWTAVRQAPLSMGILWARILEWVAISSSGGIFPT